MAVMVAAVALASLGGCGERVVIGERAEGVSFDGRRYAAISLEATDVEPAEVRPIGVGSDIVGVRVDGTVYALAGVPPADAVAMRSSEGYVVHVATDARGNVPDFASIPGLCEYILDDRGC